MADFISGFTGLGGSIGGVIKSIDASQDRQRLAQARLLDEIAAGCLEMAEAIGSGSSIDPARLGELQVYLGATARAVLSDDKSDPAASVNGVRLIALHFFPELKEAKSEQSLINEYNAMTAAEAETFLKSWSGRFRALATVLRIVAAPAAETNRNA